MDDEWARYLDQLEAAETRDFSVAACADSMDLQRGVTGYIYHTVAMAVYAWYRHFGDFEETIAALLRCGGDTDSTGAVAGALAGLSSGEEGIPVDWINGIKDWPRNTRLLRLIGNELSLAQEGKKETAPVRYFWPAIVPRNLCFLAIVLGHGLGRLLPFFYYKQR